MTVELSVVTLTSSTCSEGGVTETIWPLKTVPVVSFSSRARPPEMLTESRRCSRGRRNAMVSEVSTPLPRKRRAEEPAGTSRSTKPPLLSVVVDTLVPGTSMRSALAFAPITMPSTVAGGEAAAFEERFAHPPASSASTRMKRVEFCMTPPRGCSRSLGGQWPVLEQPAAAPVPLAAQRNPPDRLRS